MQSFVLGASNSRGAADVLEINRQGVLQLNDVSYTTCPPGSDDWLIEAGDIKLDTAAGTGTARNVKLRFEGVPILYTPYFSFPLGDARKSGILAPVIGSAGRSGNELSVPYYWNIRENYRRNDYAETADGTRYADRIRVSLSHAPKLGRRRGRVPGR